MELYVFNRDLEFIGIVESYTSLIWNFRYNLVSDFRLDANINSNNLELLQRENIIWLRGDDEAGYIESINKNIDENGNELITIQGKSLTGYLSRRIIWGQEVLKDTAEGVIRTLVNNHAVNPKDSKRKISKLFIEDSKGIGNTLDYQVSYKNLLEEIETVAKSDDIGFKVNFDAYKKTLNLNIYEGKNLSYGNGQNDPVIFSREYDNILTQNLVDSLNNYASTVLIAGEGEGAERSFVDLGVEKSDLDRYEVFVDARDLQTTKYVDNEEVQIPDAEYKAQLTQRGLEKLSEYKDIFTFDCKINVNSNLEFKKDFNIGDIVTVMDRFWGVRIDDRITEITRTFDASGVKIDVIFGNAIPTLIDKIKQRMR